MIKPPTLDDRVRYSNILPPAMVTAPRVEPTPPPLPAQSTDQLIYSVECLHSFQTLDPACIGYSSTSRDGLVAVVIFKVEIVT